MTTLRSSWKGWKRSGGEPAADAIPVPVSNEVQSIALDLLRDFEASGKGWFWATDADGSITYVSPSLARQLEMDEAELLGAPFTRLFDTADASGEDATERTLPLLMRAHKTFSDLPLRAAAGHREFCFAVSGRPQIDGFGRFTGFRGNGSDITQARQSQLDASRLALYDGLTGLANRHRMARQLDQNLASLRSSRRAFALMMLDLDRFKAVNDTLGHPAGDDLLKQVAERLRGVVDKGCEVGRLGGDEFQVIIPIEDRGRLGEVAARIIAALSEPYAVLGSQCVIGASVGIAVAPFDGEDAESLVRSADLALYASKDGGRGRFRFYSSDLHVEALRRRRIEEDLRDALARGEMSLVYEPQVSTCDGRVTGLGATIRWEHPDIGTVPTSTFMPMAEKSNVARLLGDWAVIRACADAAGWPANLRVAVSLSEAQVHNPGLVALVGQALAHSGLAAGRLELELPEVVLTKVDRTLSQTLSNLRGLGVRLVIDDFGSGRASLSHLRRTSFERLKIGRAFLADLASPDSHDAAIVGALAGIASALGLELIAGGVVARDQLAILNGLGVPIVQGPIYSAPLDAPAVLAATGPGEWIVEPSGPSRSRDERRAMLRKVGLIHDDWRYDVMMRNLSRSGCMIEGLAEVPVGTVFVVDFGDGQFAVARVRRAVDAVLGLEFEVPLVDDGAGGLVTRTRISGSALAEIGLANKGNGGTPRFRQVAEVLRRSGALPATEG